MYVLRICYPFRGISELFSDSPDNCGLFCLAREQIQHACVYLIVLVFYILLPLKSFFQACRNTSIVSISVFHFVFHSFSF